MKDVGATADAPMESGAFEVSQLQHDLLANRVTVGIHGPTATDYTTLSFSLAEDGARPDEDVATRAVAQAIRLLQQAAQALQSRQRPGEAEPAPGRPRSRMELTCTCCDAMDVPARKTSRR